MRSAKTSCGWLRRRSSPHRDAVRDFRGFVITGDADNFSVGANLMQLLLAAQEGEWDDVDLAIRAFQRMTQSIKFCPRPVVVAPYALCLGGGAEISLHGARRQAHAELYMGLVETGVGLIPGGGGCKEFALKATDEAIRAFGDASRVAISTELVDTMKQAFETIAMAKVSTSAAEARALSLLTEEDGITLNRERLLLDAKAAAEALAEGGYLPPVMRTDIPAAGESVLATLKLGVYIMRQAGYQRARREGGGPRRAHPVRRTRGSRHAGQRAVFSGPGARGVSLALR